MSIDICTVCGQPLGAHTLKLRGGVAHTVTPDGMSCSHLDLERAHLAGEINALRTIIRSLRWRAGRMWSHDQRWDASDLRRYSNHWQQRLDRYLAIVAEYYPRKERQG